MLGCEDCEYCMRSPDGDVHLMCDPFSTVKEPECLVKWQLMELRTIAQSHRATQEMYRRLAPLQEKLFAHMEREIDEANEADQWKLDENDDEDAPFGP
ncbi:MAG: hypothetical protein JSU63_11245 [Phycisphaerales bacterium]|nr:MAG: hypothetical protein JSU63_11245 [Phycisphaerales bacterium]